jgi:hypothetical protein
LTGLCTKVFGAGVQTVTDGLVVLRGHGDVACAKPVDPKARKVRTKAAETRFVRVSMTDPEFVKCES